MTQLPWENKKDDVTEKQDSDTVFVRVVCSASNFWKVSRFFENKTSKDLFGTKYQFDVIKTKDIKKIWFDMSMKDAQPLVGIESLGLTIGFRDLNPKTKSKEEFYG